MAKVRIRVKPIWQWFRATDGDERLMMTQAAKLVVLYEDIMLEIHGAIAPATLTLGHADDAYRRIYFTRRALATAWEMKQCVETLQKNRAFKESMRCWPREDHAMWDEAVGFFRTNHELIKTWRNNVGAKFTETSAVAALKAAQTKPGVIEIYEPKTGRLSPNLRFGFADLLLAGALSRGKLEHEDFDAYMTRTMHLVIEAQAHAVRVAWIIGLDVLGARR